MGFVKNMIGDLLEYGRCPLTNDTYLNSDIVSIPYSPRCGLLVLERALTEIPVEEIAQRIFDISGSWISPGEPRYDVREIASKIPYCMPLQR